MNSINQLTSLPMCGFIAQLVEHLTGIAEVAGSNSVEALIFFRLFLSNCLNWKIYCDDHSSFSLISFRICSDVALSGKKPDVFCFHQKSFHDRALKGGQDIESHEYKKRIALVTFSGLTYTQTYFSVDDGKKWKLRNASTLTGMPTLEILWFY